MATASKQQLNEQGIQLDWNSLQGQLDTLLKQSGKPELDPSNEEATQVVDNYAQAYQQAMQKVDELKQQAEQKAREA